jgi:hypothetical protein
VGVFGESVTKARRLESGVSYTPVELDSSSSGKESRPWSDWILGQGSNHWMGGEAGGGGPRKSVKTEVEPMSVKVQVSS